MADYSTQPCATQNPESGNSAHLTKDSSPPAGPKYQKCPRRKQPVHDGALAEFLRMQPVFGHLPHAGLMTLPVLEPAAIALLCRRVSIPMFGFSCPVPLSEEDSQNLDLCFCLCVPGILLTWQHKDLRGALDDTEKISDAVQLASKTMTMLNDMMRDEANQSPKRGFPESHTHPTQCNLAQNQSRLTQVQTATRFATPAPSALHSRTC